MIQDLLEIEREYSRILAENPEGPRWDETRRLLRLAYHIGYKRGRESGERLGRARFAEYLHRFRARVREIIGG